MATNPPSLPRRQLSSITNTAQQQRGLPLSSSSASTVAPGTGAGSPGSTKSKIATSTSTTTTTSTTGTLVPGRRPQYPQYQHSTSSRLENPSNHYAASSLSHHSQYQQQQGVVAGSVAGSNTNSSSALRPPPPHHATRTTALQQQSRPVVQTRVHTTTHTHTHTQTAAAISNTHTQAGATTTVATTGVTGVTGTTGATGITDKPKSRKKDKPPRLPPPEIISDNNLMIQYVRGPSLGEGGFASCFLITDQSDNRYAAKVIQKTELQSHKTRQKLFAEIKIHQSLKHENIVRYHNCFEDEDFVYLVLELCESKTLMDLIKRRKRLTEPEVRYYMKELVEGCFYLHQQKTIHRDLKLGNLFLTHDMHVRIGDFGLAAVILNEERKKTICGTPNYIAPEILFDTDNGHSFEVDIWSVGVIMYTLLVGKPPFQTNEVKAIYKKIRDNDYVFPDDVPISKEAKDLIASLLSPTPSSRPSVGDVLSHKFFSSGYFPEVLERRTLHVPPNFEEEERLWRESFRLQHADATGSLDTADNDQDQKQHLDLEQMHLSDPPASSHPKHPSSSHPAKRYPGTTSELTPLGKKPMQGQHQPTPKQSVTPNRQQQQQHQQSTPLPDPPFQYGEQIKMELVDGDRVTSEIRTINMDRGRAAPSTQQYPLGSNTRLQQQDQRKQNHLQQQQRQPATTSPLVARNESSSTLDLQQTVKTERAPRTTSSVQHSQSQTSMTRSGMVQPLSLSPSSRLESTSGTNVPSSSTASVSTSSRLPVPKSRLNSGSPQQGGQQSSNTEYLASTPTRSSFTQTQTSPKPGSPMTTGSSTPSMSASQKSTIQGHPPLQLQKASSPSPTGMGKRHPSDSTAVVPGDSGSSAKSLSQSRRQESMLNRLTAAVDEPQSKLHRMATGLMDMDADFELEMDMEIDPRNGDPFAGNAFDAMRDELDDELEQEQLQKPRRTVGSLHGLSSSRTARSKTTVIQTVHGVERPASAMQKTYQQDGEPSDAQQATVSPRKSARVMQAQLTESPSPLVRRSSQNGLHSPQQQQQQQQQRHQHSFLHTSQQGTQPPLETNHAPFAQLPRTPPSPTHRLSNRKSQQFTTDAFTSVQSHLHAHELSQEHEDLASPVFTQQQQQQHRRQHPVGLGLSEPDEPDILGEMVSSAVQGDVSMNDEDSSGSGKKHRRDLDVGTTVQKQSQRQQVQNLNRRDSMEDPQRPQLTNSLQRRNQQVKQQQQQQQFASSQSLTGSLSMNNTNNNPNKQSNETTMGMSTGGHSDEQDQVEIPSTSCVTTTSMSLSMHHDHKQQQQQQPQQQAQDVQLKTLSGLQSERIQKRKSKKVTVIDPVSPDLHLRPVGACEAVENFLRAIIRTRSEGVWISPDMEEPAPSHPAVFVTRWIDYERYGFGWQLSNGVVGVFYNDRTTLALSPNGIDIEVTESPHKRRRRHCSNPSNWLRTRSHSEQKRGGELALRKNHWCGHDRKHPHPDSNSSNTLSTPQDTNNPRSMDALTAELRAGLEYERRLDGDDEYPLMRIYDVKNNLVTSSTNRSASLIPGDNGSVTLGNGNMDNCGDEDGSIFPGMLQDQDFYDEWDYADYLETLDRTYCRMHSKEIPRLAKRIKVLEGFRNYMAHWLVSLSPWVYQDLTLTKGMPFLTDLYRRKEKKHVIARLSNGIVQINFADHSKLIFSQNGEVVTLIDGDKTSRRITMKTHQALSPEYFYDLEDEKDQEKLVRDELQEIQCNMLQRRYGTSQNEFEENRPVFHSERDQDLTLFPRPYLRAKAAKQQLFSARIQKAQDLSQGSEHSEHREHDEQHEDKLTKLVSREYVVKGEDAVTAELKDIEKNDEALAILQTTLRDLHLQLVRRIRLALKLLVARRMENAQCRMKGRLENEHYLKDRDESRRRRASRKEKEEEGKKKAKGKVDKDDEDVVKLEEEEEDGERGGYHHEEGAEQVPERYLLE